MSLSALSASGNLLLDPLYTLWYSIAQILPGVVLAILILILGYCIAYLLGYVTTVGLDRGGLNRLVKKAHLSKGFGHTNIPTLVGEIVKWFVFLVFLQVAAETLNLGGLSSLLDSFVRWLPNVLFAIIVFFGGVALAHFIEVKMHEHTRMKGMNIMAKVTKVVILFLALMVGLKQLGVEVGLLSNAFLILIAALGLGLALALGIGLGLGLRNTAEDMVHEVYKGFK